MNICVKCQKEMKCVQTGGLVHFGHGHVYSGDAFECPECGAQVLVASEHPFFVEDHRTKDFYVDMSGSDKVGA